MVREKLQELIGLKKITDSEIEKMQSESYSKNTVDIQYPMLKKVDSSYKTRIDKYWKPTYIIKGNRYVVCSEWYEQTNNNDRPYFLKWYRDLKNP